MKQVINTTAAPEPIGPYSQAVKANGFLFSSGQIAINPVDGIMVSENITEETKQVMSNIKAILKSVNLDFDAIVSTCIYLKSLNHFSIVNSVYSEYFINNFPARTTIEVSALPKGAEVEISFIALLNTNS